MHRGAARRGSSPRPAGPVTARAAAPGRLPPHWFPSPLPYGQRSQFSHIVFQHNPFLGVALHTDQIWIPHSGFKCAPAITISVCDSQPDRHAAPHAANAYHAKRTAQPTTLLSRSRRSEAQTQATRLTTRGLHAADQPHASIRQKRARRRSRRSPDAPDPCSMRCAQSCLSNLQNKQVVNQPDQPFECAPHQLNLAARSGHGALKPTSFPAHLALISGATARYAPSGPSK